MDRFCATLAAGLNSYGAAPCLDFERTWYSGNDITGYITAQSAAADVAALVETRRS